MWGVSLNVVFDYSAVIMSRPCNDRRYIQLVNEYLLHMGLNDTAKHLYDECVQYNFPLPERIEGVGRCEINKLLELYDSANESCFFKVFSSVVPQEVKCTLDYKKITLDLLVYFAALACIQRDNSTDNFPKKPLVEVPQSTSNYPERSLLSVTRNNCSSYTRHKMDTLEQVQVPYCTRSCEKNSSCRPSSADRCRDQRGVLPIQRAHSFHGSDESSRSKEPVYPCMCALLDFLERECVDLRRNPHFLPYFSLPFVVNPQTHPHYSHLFKESWMASLRRRLWDFLVKHRQAAVIPKLVLLVPSNEVHTLLSAQSSPKPCSSNSYTHEHLENTTPGKSPQFEILPQKLPSYHEAIDLSCPNSVGHASKRELITSGQETNISHKGLPLSNSKEGITHESGSESFSSSFVCDKVSFNPSCQSTQQSRRQVADKFTNCIDLDQTHSSANHSDLRFSDSCDKSVLSSTLPPHVHYLSENIPNPPAVSHANIPAVSHAAANQMLSPAESNTQNVLWHNSHSGNKQQSRDSRSDLKHSYQHLKSRYNQLHSDYHNLIGVAAELTGALEKCLRGQQVDLKKTLNNCSQISPDLFQHYPLKKSLEGAAVNQSHPDKNSSLNTVHDNTTPHSSSRVWRLDMRRVSQHLVSSSVKNKLLLLQALRWRITQTQGEECDAAVNDFVRHDMLGLLGESLLSQLLTPPNVQTPHPLQQAAARLLNALASLHCGRDYLARSTDTVTVVVRVLKEQDGIFVDRVTKDMLVAALQKLSLRRSQRVAMIDLDMVEWLVMQLSSSDSQDSQHAYSVEYSTALLMNLCLHSSAKQRCVSIADSVLRLLVHLLSTPMRQALPYVNGTLYSLLAHPKINQAAVRNNLSKYLEDHLKEQPDTEICKQLEHILHFHRSQLMSSNEVPYELGPSDGEMIDDDSEDIDLLEDELDEDDPVRNVCGELCGEELLRTHYALPNPSQGPESLMSSLDPEISKSPTFLLTRPTTPLQTTPGLMSDDSEGVVVANSSFLRPQNASINSKQRLSCGSFKQQTHHQCKQFHGKKGVSVSSGYRKQSEFEDKKNDIDKVPTKTPAINTEESKELVVQLTAGSKCEMPNSAGHSMAWARQNNQVQAHAGIKKEHHADPEKHGEIDNQCSNQLDDRLCTIPEGFITCAEVKPCCSSQELVQTESKLKKNSDAAAFASRPKIPRTPPQQN